MPFGGDAGSLRSVAPDGAPIGDRGDAEPPEARGLQVGSGSGHRGHPREGQLCERSDDEGGAVEVMTRCGRSP